MTRSRPETGFPGWRDILTLGEQLMNQPDVSAQRRLVLDTIPHLVGGSAEMWFAEPIQRLLDAQTVSALKDTPLTPAMERALRDRKIVRSRHKAAGKSQYVALPVRAHGVVLAVLQVQRAKGPAFKQEEVDLLQGVAIQTAIALDAARRVAVEQWRIEQLSLVRQVSEQVAGVAYLDELFQRVVDLILDTFGYYYVALFTLETGPAALRFRASAGPGRDFPDGDAVPSPVVHVTLGEGMIGWVAEHGEEAVAGDVSRDFRYNYEDSLSETRSEVSLPLKIGVQVLGVLDVQSDQPDDFDDTDLLVLQALADNIAVAVEGARLYDKLRRRAEHLAAVAEVSRAVNSILDTDRLLQEVVTLIHNRFGYPFVYLFTLRQDTQQVICRVGSGDRSQALRKQGLIYELTDTQGIIPWVARCGKTLMANDVSREPRYRPSPLPPANTLAELAVPLSFADQVLGVLDVQSDRRNAFTDEDRFLFEALAANVAIAMRNASLYRSERWRRRVADGMREVAAMISAEVALDNILDAVLVELQRSLPCHAAAIWLVQDGTLRLSAVRGCDSEHMPVDPRLNSLNVDSWINQALLVDHPTVRLPDWPVGPLGKALNFPADYSAIAAPLRAGEKALGMLTLVHRSPGKYGNESRVMTSAFASYASVAIQNTRLLQERQEEAYVSTALLKVAQAVARLNDLDSILDTIVHMVPTLINVDRCLLFLWNEKESYFDLSHQCTSTQVEQDAPGSVCFAQGEFPLLDVVRDLDSPISLDWGVPTVHLAQGQTESIENLPHPLVPENLTRTLLGGDASINNTLLALPLSVKGNPFGVVVVEAAPDRRRRSARWIEILRGIAQQVAIALQNDRLLQERAQRERLEQELWVAQQIQQTFMPDEMPVIPGWELAVTWRAARQVGGDFYDFLALPDRRLGLVIADVADKGVPAALFMALTKALVRAAAQENLSPAGVLGRVNELLLPDTHQGMFVTALYAVLSPSDGRITYANAGHTRPLLWKPNHRNLIKLPKGGIALGVLEDSNMFDGVVDLEPDDCLVLFTDGVVDAMSPANDLFGERRLQSILRKFDGGSAQELLEAIDRSVTDFAAGTPPADDLTLVVIRRLNIKNRMGFESNETAPE